MLDRIALILSIIGGLNWGLVGLFRFDFISFVCGGSTTSLSRIFYVLFALAAVWTVSLLFRENPFLERKHEPGYTEARYN